MKHSDKTNPTAIPSIVGGRVTGIKHTKAGEGCDDAFAWISFKEIEVIFNHQEEVAFLEAMANNREEKQEFWSGMDEIRYG